MALAATLVFCFLVYTFGFYVVRRNQGIQKNLPFAFSLAVFVLYHAITPVYFYLTGRETIWGEDDMIKHLGVEITDYYLTGINYYALANLLFILGYIVLGRNQVPSQDPGLKKIPSQQIHQAIILGFTICFGIVLFNFLNEGLNPVNVLFGSQDDVIAGITATSNYLKNFADSLIAVIIIGFYYRLPKKYLYPITILSFGLFALMGFRYRIILTILGIIFVKIFQRGSLRTKWLRIGIISAVFLYFMFFITYNRFVFTQGEWDRLAVNPLQFEYKVFFEQTRGMLDDITVIKYYKTHPDPKFDHGISFLYFLVRVMPRSIVGDEFKDSFYPYPALPIIEEAYDVKKFWGNFNTGEAPLHLIYFYIAGGFGILLLGSFLTGMLLKVIQIKYYPLTDKTKLISILLAAGLFQWYTRGYFPGFVDHMGFMLIGFWMIHLLARWPVFKWNPN